MGNRESTAPRARIYTRRWCGYCFAAKRWLRRYDVPFEEVPVDGDPDLRRRIATENDNWPTVPMIFIDGRFVGGYSELKDWHRRHQAAAIGSSRPGTRR